MYLGKLLGKATVAAWRVALEARGLGAVSINVRITAVRKLAVEAADNGLLAPEIAAGITRVKGVASKGVRLGNWRKVALRDRGGSQRQVCFRCSDRRGPAVKVRNSMPGSQHSQPFRLALSIVSSISCSKVGASSATVCTRLWHRICSWSILTIL